MIEKTFSGYKASEIKEKLGVKELKCDHCGNKVIVYKGIIQNKNIWVNIPKNILKVFCSFDCKKSAQRKMRSRW